MEQVTYVLLDGQKYKTLSDTALVPCNRAARGKVGELRLIGSTVYSCVISHGDLLWLKTRVQV
jgi:hypothetical protein